MARLHGEIERLDGALAAPGLFSDKPEKGTQLSKARADALRRLKEAEARWIDAAEKYEVAQESQSAVKIETAAAISIRG